MANDKRPVLAICTLAAFALINCSPSNASLNLVTVAPPLPTDWQFRGCVDYDKKCDLEIPLPEGIFIDTDGAGPGRYFWIFGGKSFPAVSFHNLERHRNENIFLHKDISLEEIAKKTNLYAISVGIDIPKNISEPITMFSFKHNSIELLKRKLGNFYDYLIRTPKFTFHITDGGIYGKYPPLITEKNILLLETALLNARLNSHVREDFPSGSTKSASRW